MIECIIFLLIFFGTIVTLQIVTIAILCLCSKETRTEFINDWKRN